jgi:hypothetical protein
MHVNVSFATLRDLDDVTKLAQAGFPDDPEFDYRFPKRHEFPEDNWEWTKREYEGYLNQPDKYAVLLATLPTVCQGHDVERTRPTPIALAVWDVSVTTESKGGGLSSFLPA